MLRKGRDNNKILKYVTYKGCPLFLVIEDFLGRNESNIHVVINPIVKY